MTTFLLAIIAIAASMSATALAGAPKIGRHNAGPRHDGAKRRILAEIGKQAPGQHSV